MSSLEGGFANPTVDAAQAFRAAMQAMARPGQIREVCGAQPPAPLSVAAGVLILTLCDGDTPVYLAGAHDSADVRQWIAFHTGAPISDPAGAMFALGTWEALQPLDPYPLGQADYPDRSATLIVEVPELANQGATLTGPGIAHSARLSLPETDAFQRNAACFPLGLDFYLTCGARLAALPRTIKVAAKEGAV